MRVIFYSPHPDDETLSMGIAMLYYIAAGVETHLVSITNGSAVGVSYTLNGINPTTNAVVPCTLGVDHPFIHDPVREGYLFPPPVGDDPPCTSISDVMVGDIRNKEARAALGMMSQIAPNTPGVYASVTHHTENLPGDFAGTSPSSTSPPSEAGIQMAYDIIKRYVDEYPNSFHFTMSETDDHHDHAACGIALRRLKNDTTNFVPWNTSMTYATALSGARFFVSKLYWQNNYANGQDVIPFGPSWFPYGPRYNDYVSWLRNQVVPVYKAWNPSAGAYGVGYHQVSSQFVNNFAPTVNPANLWHL